MNIIKHITEKVCATCGAEPVRERRERHNHCNGQQFEEREFACGRRVRWVPNFERMEVDRLCPNAPVEKIRAANIEKGCKAFAELADELGWTKEQKRRLDLDVRCILDR